MGAATQNKNNNKNLQPHFMYDLQPWDWNSMTLILEQSNVVIS